MYVTNPDYGVTVHPAPASSKCEKHFTCKRSQNELIRYYIFRRLTTVAVEETVLDCSVFDFIVVPFVEEAVTL